MEMASWCRKMSVLTEREEGKGDRGGDGVRKLAVGGLEVVHGMGDGEVDGVAGPCQPAVRDEG